MKKSLIYICQLLAIAIAVSSCSQQDFDDNYYDPERSVTADIPKLFTGMIYNHNRVSGHTIFPRYWNLYTFEFPTAGVYTQTFAYQNNEGRYVPNVQYGQERWGYFYTSYFASYADLVSHFERSTEDEQVGFRLFVETANVFIYDQAAQMVDIWGDIPFSEAGRMIRSGGVITGSNAAYDSQEELYNFFIDDLKRIADWLNTDGDQIEQFYKNQFDRADILNLGSLQDWKIYANSLRLRLAMRISYQNEAKAREVVAEILNNPGTYPVITENSNSVKIDARGETLRSVVNLGGQGIRGVFESASYNFAPGFMVNDIMVPSDDPRLPAMFTLNAEGEYRGMDPALTATQQANQIAANLISRVDSATYSTNDKYPGVIITAPEISFLKAEAAERWGIGNARQEYERGIRQSIDFIYYINGLNDNADGTSYTPLPPPSETAVNAYLNHAMISYDGTQDQRLEKIATQQWLNFGVMQATQAWAEYRRTKYPVLTFLPDPGQGELGTPPARLMYPENERTYNPANYEAVRAQDTYTNRIFWDVR